MSFLKLNEKEMRNIERDNLNEMLKIITHSDINFGNIDQSMMRWDMEIDDA